MRKTIVLLLMTAAILTAAFALLRGNESSQGALAVITVNGEVVQTIDLAAITEPQTFTIVTETGDNIIRAEPNRIRIADADCPDGICVETGWISAGDLPIVCLPHKLVITIETGGDDDIDGVVG